MSYDVRCSKCLKTSTSPNIVDLQTWTDYGEGEYRFECPNCKQFGGSIARKRKLQEGEVWKYNIVGMIPLADEKQTYSPFVFLTCDSRSPTINGVHFNYYKNLRDRGGRLKQGAGPGGGPFLRKHHVLLLIRALINAGFITKTEVRRTIA
ncbi:MAG: hypothetical protein WCC59_06675 [Terriglobales bacterium]